MKLQEIKDFVKELRGLSQEELEDSSDSEEEFIINLKYDPILFPKVFFRRLRKIISRLE